MTIDEAIHHLENALAVNETSAGYSNALLRYYDAEDVRRLTTSNDLIEKLRAVDALGWALRALEAMRVREREAEASK